MFFLRASRSKLYLRKDISSNILKIVSSLRYHHLCPSNKKPFPKILSALNLKYEPCINYVLRHSYCNASNLGIISEDIKRGDSEFLSEKKSSVSDSDCNSEHPDAADQSKQEVEEFYKLYNIKVKGINIPKPILRFSELCLPEHLRKILDQENYSEPTPIQSLGWPVALSHRDMVGVSQTGSGKTLAYMLPAIVHASNVSSGQRSNNRFSICKPKVLVLGPTRELVQQIHQVSQNYLQASRLRGALAYGGAARSMQLRNLQGAEVCIATPGRLLDFLENREVSLKECSYLVLDEADRMLDMGFEPQIRDVIQQISGKRQTLMWSATWPKEIRTLAEEFLTDYIHITVGSDDLVANPNIQQHVYVMQEHDKDERLITFLRNTLENEQCKVLIFAQTKRKVDYLSRLLQDERIPAWGIHGDCSQRQRDNVLYRFRKTIPSVLIATDVASRGLDISDINHIVNYDLPTNIEDYIHRIGRTARGSACGESHSFFTEENTNILKDLIAVLKQSNQTINPELLRMSKFAVQPKPTFKPRGRPFNQRPNYNRNRNRMYNPMMY